MKKGFFFGKYYKFISINDDFSFALIDSIANEGKMAQIITNEKAHFIKDPNQIEIKDNVISFNVDEEDIKLKGTIILGELHPLKGKVMGPFSIFPMECKHSIYSMYHSLSGEIMLNNKKYSFDKGYGYIEGDEGVNFPKKYIWYNSVHKDYGVTLAIATIPFGFIKFTGLLTFIKIKDKEYKLCTYNFAKIKKVNREEIVIKKGKYKFVLKVNDEGGHLLKAPTKGNMDRYIKENIRIETSFTFYKGQEVIIDDKDIYSSLEYMFD